MSIFDPEQLTTWISQNPDWALFIVFAIAFIESLAVIGLLMPGWLLLVGVGVLIGTGNLNFYLASFFCFIGAVAGEYLSYLVGVHYQHKVHHWKIFKKHPDWLFKTEKFFIRFGVASIALGRFVGPVRAFVPLLAGMSSMPLMRFQVTNILSALIWAPVYLTPGVILGASVHIESTGRWILLSNIIIIVISAWIVISTLKNIWYVRHPASLTANNVRTGNETTEYDKKTLVPKLLCSLVLFISAMIYLLTGSQNQQFLHLVEMFWQIINP